MGKFEKKKKKNRNPSKEKKSLRLNSFLFFYLNFFENILKGKCGKRKIFKLKFYA
jgi:hypothetical protein